MLPPEDAGAPPEDGAPETIAPTTVEAEDSAVEAVVETFGWVTLVDEGAARERADKIRSAVDQAWRLLAEAHEARDWEVLGYPSWADYVHHEFGVSRRRSYQLLHHARVVRELEAGGVNRGTHLTERQTRGVEPEEVRQEIDQGVQPEEAVSRARERRGTARRRAETPEREPRPAPTDAEAALHRFILGVERIEQTVAPSVQELADVLQGEHGPLVVHSPFACEWRDVLVGVGETCLRIAGTLAPKGAEQ